MLPPTPRKPERPVLWIIAGPNGSGKSSLYNRSDIEGWGGSVWIINPDLLTQHIVEHEAQELLAANLAAVQRIESWLVTSLDVYQTIGVETVLSSSKYRALVDKARAQGFEVRMLFVLLRNVAMQIERVRIRVASGGHDIERLVEALINEDPVAAKKIGEKYAELDETRFKRLHIERLQKGLKESIGTSSVHLDLINYFNRINEHVAYIAERILWLTR